MVENRVEVKLKSGLQARQAALFVQEANRYRSDVYLQKDEKESKCKVHYGDYEPCYCKRHSRYINGRW